MTTQPSLQPPGPVTVQAGDGQLTLRWSASPSPQAVAYRIYRRSPDGTWPAQAMEGTTHLEYADLEVQNGVVYAYRIATVDAQGAMSMAQEASGMAVAAPSLSAASEGLGSIAKRTAILAGVLVLVAGGLGGFVYGKSSGEKAGETSGETAGDKAGYKKGAAEVQAQYAKGASGYKTIYDAGYSAGSKSGKAVGKAEGKAEGEKKGQEVGFEEGKDSGKKAGQVQGEKDAYALALGGYATWDSGLPYLVNVKATDQPDMPYGINNRHAMQSGYDYYLCSSGKDGVCRSKKAVK